MYGIVLVLHVLICIFLVIVVLLQQTRGAGISSVFGGGGTDSLFGGKGATPFFVKLTSGLAIGFFITSLTLVLLSKRPAPRSAIERGLETETPVPPGTGVPTEELPGVPAEAPPSGGE
jgi:preprotein translocase subunit SecG